MIMIGSAGGSIADLTRGLWRGESGKRWLVPLAVFLCVFGVILILATTVEALAPFIYAIF
jgi:hypothetical protein